MKNIEIVIIGAPQSGKTSLLRRFFSMETLKNLVKVWECMYTRKSISCRQENVLDSVLGTPQ